MIRNPTLISAILISLLTATSPALAGNDADLSGLWAFRCEEGQVSGGSFPLEEFSAALFTAGSAISGACTGEAPDPWNGMVTGRFDESGLDLEILLVKSPLTVARMIGVPNGSGVFAGSFACTDETGEGWTGTFSAVQTSPDTSLYEPAASEPLTFVPVVSGGISDFEEETTAAPVEEESNEREMQVISYSRDTIYARPVM